MIHQPSGGMQGQSRDMEINLKQMQELRKDLYSILASHSGKSYEEIEKDSDRDYWMRASEAKSYGLIDEVLKKYNLKIISLRTLNQTCLRSKKKLLLFRI